jgi:4-hydroxy-3-polyprenylbenzoate decarboxylase
MREVLVLLKYIVGITGASGSTYGLKLVRILLEKSYEVHLVITDNGKKVMAYETGLSEKELLAELSCCGGNLIFHNNHDLFSSIASGSFKTDGMVVVPCSMSTLGEIAWGVSKNLLGRAADVCIKEGRKLILVPRETPLSKVHIRNMLSLSESGAVILPAMPAFYQKPSTVEDMVDFIVGRVLDSLGVENILYKKWGSSEE